MQPGPALAIPLEEMRRMSVQREWRLVSRVERDEGLQIVPHPSDPNPTCHLVIVGAQVFVAQRIIDQVLGVERVTSACPRLGKAASRE
jgi:hypothetical protein